MIPRSETVAGEWRARVLRVPRGVRCLQLRRRSACEVLRGSRAAIVNRQVIGGQTALSAWGPRLRRVVVTRTGGPPVSAAAGRRPPLFVFGEVVEAFDLRVELHFAGGAVRVVQGDAARRVFAADPFTAGRWTAYSARVDGERCAVFDPVGFEGVTGDTCRRGAPDGFFATDARDPEGRVIVYGIAGARIAQVLVGTPSTTAELPRAERGGAFLAVVRGPVEPGTLTVTVRRTDGSVASYNAASGTF